MNSSKKIYVAILALVLMLVSACVSNKLLSVNSKHDYKLIWSDEFNYVGLPDATKWGYETGGHGWGNNEKQYYKEKSIKNSFVKDGNLHIVALKEKFENSNYTSAKLTTYQKMSLQYVGKDENMVHVSLHSQLYNHVINTQITHFEKIDDVVNNFHKYGIEWDEKSIKFFIDDKLFYESVKGENGRVTANEGWPCDKPFYLILNLAIGGNWGADIDDSIFPNEMEIDYVRIYK